MNRVLKGLSYTFSRNIGWQDRIVRAVIGAVMPAAYLLGITHGVIGIILGTVGVMLLATAIVARCSICYMAGVCSIDAKERQALDKKGIRYEI